MKNFEKPSEDIIEKPDQKVEDEIITQFRADFQNLVGQYDAIFESGGLKAAEIKKFREEQMVPCIVKFLEENPNKVEEVENIGKELMDGYLANFRSVLRIAKEQLGIKE